MSEYVGIPTEDEEIIEVEVVSEWRSISVIEVPASLADVDCSKWPYEYLEQVTSDGAEWIDWSQHVRK